MAFSEMTRAFCLVGALRARAGFGEYMVQYNLVVEGAMLQTPIFGFDIPVCGRVLELNCSSKGSCVALAMLTVRAPMVSCMVGFRSLANEAAVVHNAPGLCRMLLGPCTSALSPTPSPL